MSKKCENQKLEITERITTALLMSYEINNINYTQQKNNK